MPHSPETAPAPDNAQAPGDPHGSNTLLYFLTGYPGAVILSGRIGSSVKRICPDTCGPPIPKADSMPSAVPAPLQSHTSSKQHVQQLLTDDAMYGRMTREANICTPTLTWSLRSIRTNP